MITQIIIPLKVATSISNTFAVPKLKTHLSKAHRKIFKIKRGDNSERGAPFTHGFYLAFIASILTQPYE